MASEYLRTLKSIFSPKCNFQVIKQWTSKSMNFIFFAPDYLRFTDFFFILITYTWNMNINPKNQMILRKRICYLLPESLSTISASKLFIFILNHIGCWHACFGSKAASWILLIVISNVGSTGAWKQVVQQLSIVLKSGDNYSLAGQGNIKME